MWGIILLWLWYEFPWWIVRLSIFSYTFWLFVYFLWRNSYPSLFSLFHFSNTMTLTLALVGHLSFWIAGMGEPGGLPSMGSHRVRHNWSDLAAAAADDIHLFLLWATQDQMPCHMNLCDSNPSLSSWGKTIG